MLKFQMEKKQFKKNNMYNELLCQHKKIHRFKVYKLYSLFVLQFIALEGFIHSIMLQEARASLVA